MPKRNVSPKNARISEGIVASHGIALAKALVLPSDQPYVPSFRILKSQIDQEINRLDQAVEKTEHDLRALKERVDSAVLRENLRYLDSHLLILRDPYLRNQILTVIHQKLMNIETVFGEVMQGLIDQMEAIEDDYLRDRVEDFRDIHKRVLFNLLGLEDEQIEHLNEDVVLIAYSLSPSQTAAMDKQHVKGLVTEVGGKASHSAILARALEIPAILGVHGITARVKPGDMVILDANHNRILINPADALVRQYTTAKHVFDRFLKKLSLLNELPGKTTDGVKIDLFANIEIPDEIEAVRGHGAEGIGLFRSEFLFLNAQQFPDEESQLATYRSVIDGMGDHPVVIRTMDLGGDKLSREHNEYHENNPFLGWRSIRFCLARPELFQIQLRALLRASVKQNLRIMLPMISGVEELLQARKIINQVKKELAREKIPFNENIKTGIMVEVPSAVMVLDALAGYADFFSIGTNDLIQYTIAVDRGNERVSYLYNGLHPAVLRLIKNTIDCGKRHSRPVEMCGEMAGNPFNTVLLVGMGLRCFSMSASFIPEVKKVIRSVSTVEAEALARKALSLNQIDQIEKLVKDFLAQRLPEMAERFMI